MIAFLNVIIFCFFFFFFWIFSASMHLLICDNEVALPKWKSQFIARHDWQWIFDKRNCLCSFSMFLRLAPVSCHPQNDSRSQSLYQYMYVICSISVDFGNGIEYELKLIEYPKEKKMLLNLNVNDIYAYIVYIVCLIEHIHFPSIFQSNHPYRSMNSLLIWYKSCRMNMATNTIGI